MLFWLIIVTGFILGCISFSKWSKKEYKTIDKPLVPVAGVIGAGCGLIVAFVVCLIVSSCINDHYATYKVERKTLVAALDDQTTNSHLSGVFILVAGGLNGSSSQSLNYAWYEQAANGAITSHDGIRQDDNTKIEIYYTAPDENPYIIHKTEHIHTTTRGWIAPINLAINDNNYDPDETWELHVPHGSIVPQYKFDLK